MIGWLQISAGRGPEECGWVVFQLVPYLIREAGQCGLKTKLIEAVPGNGSKTWKSAVIAVEGEKKYMTDFLSTWQGAVQWIGKSMFRPNHKRKNWFVGVEIFKPVDQKAWDLKNIRVERMRSSGPGGQHANKTETAIRVTHIPTGLCAVSQQERSQYLNKNLALARLKELMHQKKNQSKAELDGMRWHQHNGLERGNAGQIFEGKDFRRKPY